MDRAARVLRKSKLAAEYVTPEQVAVASWPGVIGKRLALHTKAVTLVDGKLLVDVGDETWRRQLTSLKPHILRRIEKVLGAGMVKDLHFRVGVSRKQPGVEVHPVRGGLFDEEPDAANRIADPGLSRIYNSLRKRASA